MVVAIIGLLASIVLSSLQSARLKAADASVRQEMTQLRTIMEQERSNSGIYTAIKNGDAGGFKAANSTCSATNFAVGGVQSQYAANAADVCTKLIAAASTGSGGSTGSAGATGCGASCVYFQTTSPNSAEKYTIMAYLPYTSVQAGAARYLCMGSSGNQSVSDGAAWTEEGCLNNP